MGGKTTGFKIFICYIRDTGKDFASHLKKGLERQGIHAFLDIEDVPKKSKEMEWWKFRDQAIRDSEIFLLLITIGIEASSEVRKEIALARKEKKGLSGLDIRILNQIL